MSEETPSEPKDKLPVNPWTRLRVIMLRGAIIACGGWLATTSGKNVGEIVWQEWGGLAILVLGALCNHYLDYTSMSWARFKAAVTETITKKTDEEGKTSSTEVKEVTTETGGKIEP